MHAHIKLFTILFISQEAQSLIVAFAERKSWITSNTDPPLTCTRPREWRRDSQSAFPSTLNQTHTNLISTCKHSGKCVHTHTHSRLSAVNLHMLASLLHSIWSAGSSNTEDLQGRFRLWWLFPKTAIYVKMISYLKHDWFEQIIISWSCVMSCKDTLWQQLNAVCFSVKHLEAFGIICLAILAARHCFLSLQGPDSSFLLIWTLGMQELLERDMTVSPRLFHHIITIRNVF